MKIEIFEERETKEKKVELKLFKDSDGEVRVCVVDEDGDDECTLLTFKPDNTIVCNSGVDHDYGWAVDSDGHLIIEDEDDSDDCC